MLFRENLLKCYEQMSYMLQDAMHMARSDEMYELSNELQEIASALKGTQNKYLVDEVRAEYMADYLDGYYQGGYYEQEREDISSSGEDETDSSGAFASNSGQE